MKIDRALTIAGGLITLALFIWGVSFAWNNLNNKIDNGLKEANGRLDDLQRKSVDAQCLQILSRRLVAIEKRLGETEKKLVDMTREYGCLPGVFDSKDAAILIDRQLKNGARPRPASVKFGEVLKSVDASMIAELDCQRVRSEGKTTPITRGSPDYSLAGDRDNDGLACE
jgi:hypothetical protein